MKILAKFLLSGGFIFFVGVPVLAQDCRHGFMWDNNVQSIIEDLEQRQDCLNKKLQYQDNDYSKIEIYDLQDKLKQTEADLRTAKTKLETLEDRLRTAEEAIQLLQLRAWMPPRPASKPKAPASKPKAPIRKPTSGFIPDAANKPKAPVNKQIDPATGERIQAAPVN